LQLGKQFAELLQAVGFCNFGAGQLDKLIGSGDDIGVYLIIWHGGRCTKLVSTVLFCPHPFP